MEGRALPCRLDDLQQDALEIGQDFARGDSQRDDIMRSQQGVGSTAVRDSILQVRPVLSLHGHIHESRGTTKLGGTLAINSGSAYTEGVLQGAIVSLQGNKVNGFQLVTG